MLTPRDTSQDPTREKDLREVRDPECCPERWWSMATWHAYEAMSSPLFDLLTLESPERWMALMFDHAEDWISEYHSPRNLRFRQQAKFSLDCAERALPYTQAEARSLATEIITLARKLADKVSHLHEWHDPPLSLKCDELFQIHKACGMKQHANSVIASLARIEGLWEAPRAARDAIAQGLGKHWAPGLQQEIAWQWRRLVFYLDQSQGREGGNVSATNE